MSGHSKWANIKNKKGAADAKRGAVFTKIGREIAVAVKAGGPDPASNSKLRDAIAKAKAANMPGDNIERSIKKASGELTAVNYEENVYEGYAQEGVAVREGGGAEVKIRVLIIVRPVAGVEGDDGLPIEVYPAHKVGVPVRVQVALVGDEPVAVFALQPSIPAQLVQGECHLPVPVEQRVRSLVEDIAVVEHSTGDSGLYDPIALGVNVAKSARLGIIIGAQTFAEPI